MPYGAQLQWPRKRRAGLGLQGTEPADREEADPRADQQRAEQTEAHVARQTLERVDGLLFEVRDEQVFELR